MASGGIGTVTYVSGELFKMMAGVDLVHVPYRGSPPALTDLVGGQMQVMFDTVPTSLGFLRAGKLRPLAVTTTTRLDSLPDVPPLSEFLPGYETSFWLGIGAPRNTPQDIVQTLNREITAGLGNAKLKSQILDLGSHSNADDARTIRTTHCRRYGEVEKKWFVLLASKPSDTTSRDIQPRAGANTVCFDVLVRQRRRVRFLFRRGRRRETPSVLAGSAVDGVAGRGFGNGACLGAQRQPPSSQASASLPLPAEHAAGSVPAAAAAHQDGQVLPSHPALRWRHRPRAASPGSPVADHRGPPAADRPAPPTACLGSAPGGRGA